jgi:MFS transporter, DHA3 family, tetracycline resistance protein
MVGDGIFTVTLALETLRVDDHPTALSFVLAARLAPTVLLLLLGGVIVDRVPPRMAMLVSDAVRGLTVAFITLGVATGRLRLWELVVMAVIFGIGDAFSTPAEVAIVPELLPTELLVQGNALTATSQQGAKFAGPAIGGIIAAAFGLAWGFGLDAASFAVSAVTLAIMTRRQTRPPTGRSMLAEAREGLRYCFSQRWLWVAMVASGVANFAAFAPVLVLVPVLIRNGMHQPPVALGFVIAAGGVGGALTSIIVGRTGAPRLRVTAIWLSWALASSAVIGLAFAPNPWVAGLLVAVVWAMLMYGNVLWTPLMQERVPASLLGRAASVDWMFSFVGTPVGMVVAGVVAGRVGPRTALFAGGIVAAITVLGVLVPGVRDPERRPVEQPVQQETSV